ncbi:hypothetical protein PTTW11_05595 [Pyrenophora teres f. teres]|uniref:Uncharacterized protein n=1 Tax=Pyrenophora teres f. teres TaxID=97479 RepID=A0A6S6W255_9PLEO|nr:hypothetical protein PTTW11_05595 [Pyrenophora teres f. teres]
MPLTSTGCIVSRYNLRSLGSVSDQSWPDRMTQRFCLPATRMRFDELPFAYEPLPLSTHLVPLSSSSWAAARRSRILPQYACSSISPEIFSCMLAAPSGCSEFEKTVSKRSTVGDRTS